jgi:hypothetical protein
MIACAGPTTVRSVTHDLRRICALWATGDGMITKDYASTSARYCCAVKR